jgi:hypothetical protein
MAEASKTDDFGDLSYGDETRRDGDHVGLPHDQQSGGTSDVRPGQAVSIDGSGNIKQAEDGDVVVGVLQNYQRAGDSGGPADPAPIQQDREATVATRGVVKVEVSNDTGNSLDVSAGDELGVDGTDGVAGVLDSGGSPETDYIALTDATEDDRPDGTTAHYAEVLLR